MPPATTTNGGVLEQDPPHMINPCTKQRVCPPAHVHKKMHGGVLKKCACHVRMYKVLARPPLHLLKQVTLSVIFYQITQF